MWHNMGLNWKDDEEVRERARLLREARQKINREGGHMCLSQEEMIAALGDEAGMSQASRADRQRQSQRKRARH